jgi:DNA-binding beta-propeller fold protein YncE
MNVRQARVRLVQVGVAFAAAALIAGCGSQYRSVVTPVNPSGPASQPQAWAVVVSAPTSTTNGVTTKLPGIATIFDYSGDSVQAWAYLLGNGPLSLTIDETASDGYTVNSDHTITDFPVSSTLQYKNESYLTLPESAELVNLFTPASGVWAADLCDYNSSTKKCGSNEGATDLFTGSPESFVDAITVAPEPVMVIGTNAGGQRDYTISQNISGTVAGHSADMACNIAPHATTIPNGKATGIEISSSMLDTPITVGKCPVYAVENSDGNRLFVINRGSDTVSVINTAKDDLDECTPFTNPATGQMVNCHPTLPLSSSAVQATGITPTNGVAGTVNMPKVAGPVYAEYNIATSQLVVADYEGGTISIIDVSLDAYGYDSASFGTTYTVKVGQNPASVTVLYDGSRAYTANQTDSTVSIVNLSSHTIEKAALGVEGHPRTVASTQNSIYGKVYAASPDTNILNIINAEDGEDIVTATPSVTGNIVDVRVSSQEASSSGSANFNNVSRLPGFGQPCNLPLSEFNPATYSNPTLANCQVQDPTLLVK